MDRLWIEPEVTVRFRLFAKTSPPPPCEPAEQFRFARQSQPTSFTFKSSGYFLCCILRARCEYLELIPAVKQLVGELLKAMAESIRSLILDRFALPRL